MYNEIIIDHYINIWGANPNIYLWDKGPIEKLSTDFRILEFSPTESRDMWTYATCGLSDLGNPQPIELHIFSSKRDITLVELLTAVAYYHRNTAFLDLNDIINFGKSWQGSSDCSFGFISLPFLDGPDLENLFIRSEEITVKFYWIIPIMESERQYLLKFGVEELEEKFDEGFNYLDPNRKSVVT